MSDNKTEVFFFVHKILATNKTLKNKLLKIVRRLFINTDLNIGIITFNLFNVRLFHIGVRDFKNT